jgi:hypothetical protein
MWEAVEPGLGFTDWMPPKDVITVTVSTGHSNLTSSLVM